MSFDKVSCPDKTLPSVHAPLIVGLVGACSTNGIPSHLLAIPEIISVLIPKALLMQATSPVIILLQPPARAFKKFALPSAAKPETAPQAEPRPTFSDGDLSETDPVSPKKPEKIENLPARPDPQPLGPDLSPVRDPCGPFGFGSQPFAARAAHALRAPRDAHDKPNPLSAAGTVAAAAGAAVAAAWGAVPVSTDGTTGRPETLYQPYAEPYAGPSYSPWREPPALVLPRLPPPPPPVWLNLLAPEQPGLDLEHFEFLAELERSAAMDEDWDPLFEEVIQESLAQKVGQI